MERCWKVPVVMTVDMAGLGKFVRHLRGKRGLKQREVSAPFDRQPNWVSLLERGKLTHLLTPEEMTKLAGILDCDVSDLLRAAGYEVRREDLEVELSYGANGQTALDEWNQIVSRLTVVQQRAIIEMLRTFVEP